MNVSTNGSNRVGPRNFWRRGLLGGVLMAVGLVAATPSCSFVVDTSTEQCNASIACPAGKSCVDGVCLAGAAGCATTDECVADNGDFSYCRKTAGAEKGVCVALKSPLCDTVIGNYKAPDPFIFGSIHPTKAPAAADADVGIAMEESIKLALSELQKSAKGLPVPNDTARREVVMIGCSDNAESADSVTAAKHLVNDVGVQAVIGGAFSGIAIETTTQVTIPGKALFITASGTSPAITDLSDKPTGAQYGLVWRTVPSDNFQAKAIAQYMSVVEASVRAELNMPTDPIKVGVLHTSDAYGTGLRDALQPNLVFNGKKALDNGSNYFVVQYDDYTMDPPATYYAEAKDKAIMEGAHVIFMFGFSEAVNEVFAKIEIGWTATTHRPRYVFSDAVYGEALANAVNVGEADPVKRADWRRRTTGVIPGPSDQDQLFKGFLVSYASGMRPGDPSIFGAASAYDAAYLLFFAAASITDGPITGVKLAEGMAKMSKADPIEAVVNVGAAELPGALNKISAGTYKSIDYNGAFGPLNFDAATGEPAANVQIYCLANDGTGKAKSQLSGAFYNADTDMLEATEKIDTVCQ
ncbi:MAG TPA: ABC transporter substrate-binding protein [Polyangium sp.]|nr:ABC transporter substrate-binding protein [Polyangium sp.]